MSIILMKLKKRTLILLSKCFFIPVKQNNLILKLNHSSFIVMQVKDLMKWHTNVATDIFFCVLSKKKKDVGCGFYSIVVDCWR